LRVFSKEMVRRGTIAHHANAENFQLRHARSPTQDKI
jgi:hypothetical protein